MDGLCSPPRARAWNEARWHLFATFDGLLNLPAKPASTRYGVPLTTIADVMLTPWIMGRHEPLEALAKASRLGSFRG